MCTLLEWKFLEIKKRVEETNKVPKGKNVPKREANLMNF